MRFWLGKLIGFVGGLLICVSLMLSLAYPLNSPMMRASNAPVIPISKVMLHLLPLALVMGLVFGLVGQAWERRRQKAANQRSAQRIAATMQAEQAENVWPPPPDRGDTDDIQEPCHEWHG